MYGHPHLRPRWRSWTYRMDLIQAVLLFVGAAAFFACACIGLWRAW